MKLAVFASLLVVLTAQAESSGCVGTTVEVLVANGQDLTGDGWGYPDPYVKVSIGDTINTTKTMSEDANPVWWEKFQFESASSNLLKIDVWEADSGARGADDHLGTCVEKISWEESHDRDSYSSIDCVVVDGGRVKVFYKCLGV